MKPFEAFFLKYNIDGLVICTLSKWVRRLFRNCMNQKGMSKMTHFVQKTINSGFTFMNDEQTMSTTINVLYVGAKR